MEQQIKQRLVGAVVLVALAVIFLPMILNGPRVSESGAIPTGVPPEPVPSAPPALELSAAAPTVLPVEGKPGGVKPAPKPAPGSSSKSKAGANTEASARSIAPPKTTPAAKRAPPEPSPNVSPKPTSAKSASPISWTVQVGSFTERAKAFKFRDELRKAKFPAFVVEPPKGKKYFKVRVGPELEEARARRAMERLAKERKIKGFIVKHRQ